MKQTAVEWYFKQMQSKEHFTQDEFYSIYEQAKEMEKRHIMDANTAGVNCGLYGYKNAEEYYKKTFTKQTRKQNDNINVTNK
jgi:hypothetical protein